MKNTEIKIEVFSLRDSFLELAKYSLDKYGRTTNTFYLEKAKWFSNEAKVLKDLLAGYK